MSYSFDGKIANQRPKIINLTSAKTRCEKCNKTIEAPFRTHIGITAGSCYLVFSYINTPHYIYETKAGISVTYCSKYCRDKHNHRFAKS